MTGPAWTDSEARRDLEEMVWQAVSYVADDGTSGYLLSETRVKVILAAADVYVMAAMRRLAVVTGGTGT